MAASVCAASCAGLPLKVAKPLGVHLWTSLQVSSAIADRHRWATVVTGQQQTFPIQPRVKMPPTRSTPAPPPSPHR